MDTLGWSLIGIRTSKNYERPASPQMVPFGSPDAQASGLRRGTAGAHSYEVIPILLTHTCARGRLAGIAPSSGHRHLEPASAVPPARHCFGITSSSALVDAALPAAHAGRLRLPYHAKSAPKRLGFEAPAEQPRTPSGRAPSGGHVGRRQAAQAGFTVSYDVLGLSNAQE